MTQAMLRASAQTRDEILAIGQTELAGATVDETLRQLLDDHRRLSYIRAARRLRADPQQWAGYLAEAAELDEGFAELVSGDEGRDA